MTVRVGVIGSGFGARVVAPAFAGTDGCEVVDVVSARDAHAVDALVSRTDVDLVSVHSPPFRHAAHVQRAVEHGKAVLCDKPFTRSAAESAALHGAAVDAGVVHLVNFEFRYHPARRLLRELVSSGALGRVEHVSWTHISSGTRVPLRPYGWLFDRDLGGGWIGAWASHAVDTLRFCIGEVVDAVGFPRTDISERPDRDGTMRPCTAEDGLIARLELRGGVSVAIDSTFAAPVSVAPRLVVAGSDALVEIVADERATLRRADGTREELSMPSADFPDADRHDLAMRMWAGVVRDAVRTGDVPEGAPTFADGHACDAVLERLAGAT